MFWVLIYLLVISSILYIVSRKREGFSNTHEFVSFRHIKFLTSDEAKNVFSSMHFGYLHQMRWQESVARTGIDHLPRENFHESVRQAFKDGCQNFNNDDVKWLTQFIRSQPYLTQFKWNFIKTDSRLDFGFPYTIGPYIVLPEHLVESMRTSPQRLFKTLVHEMLHIYQRYNSMEFKNYYEKKKNWKFFARLEIPLEIVESTVTNPDGFEYSGAWLAFVNGFWYYYCLSLDDSSTPTGKAFAVKMIDDLPRVIADRCYPLGDFAKFQDMVGSCYHPNEQYAYQQSEILTDVYYQEN